MTVRVVVVGDLQARLSVRTPRLPRPHQTVPGDDFQQGIAGSGVLLALAALHLGARVSLVGAVGDDVNAAHLREQLVTAGIDIAHVVTVTDAPTGVSLHFAESEKKAMGASVPGANARLTGAHVKAAESVIAASDVLLTTLAPAHSAVERALQIAKDNSVLTVLKPEPVSPVEDRLLALAAVLTPNEEQLRALAQHNPSTPPRPDQINVCTLGAAGAQWFHRDGDEMKTGRVPGFSVRVVDPSGAGGVFTAALGVQLARGTNLETATRFANAAGALTTTVRGEVDAVPAEADVTALLAQASDH
jgi:ribokinase